MKFHGDKTLILTVVVATGSFLLAACSSVPKWVDKGGGYMTEKDGKAFYGVGAVTGIRNEPLAKETADNRARSEEHTSELQSPCNLVCRLLLEKKKKKLMIKT